MQFSQVGELESSKSAIKVDAPEFKALIIIFLSTGPVISTRLSCKSLGNLLHTQFSSLIPAVSSGNFGKTPSSIFCCTIFLADNNSNLS